MTTVRSTPQQIEASHQPAAADAAPTRKPFVEPEISSPVDVLEATTFFQAVESGGTGIRRNDD